MNQQHQLLFTGFSGDGPNRSLALENLKSSDGCVHILCNALRLKRDAIIACISEPEKEWRMVVRASPSGKRRVCFSPSPRLRLIQTRLVRYFMRQASSYYVGRDSDVNPYATAFGSGDSIVKNAEFHRTNKSSLVLDLRDAFASIKTKHIYRYLKRLTGNNHLAWISSRLLTLNGRLRQGAPSSQHVFNLMMTRFDKAVAKIKEVTYTRYGDDLCFSSSASEFPTAVEDNVRKVITSFNLRLNHKRKVGKNGVMPLPGVRIVNGRIEPDIASLERYAEAKKAHAPEKVIQGFEGFLGQFGRGGRRYAQKRLARLASQN